MVNSSKDQKTFYTVNQIVNATGLKYKQILNDIHLGKLAALKKGNSYYIYYMDYEKYLYELIAEARGLDKDAYTPILGIDGTLLQQYVIKGVMLDDKLKNEK